MIWKDPRITELKLSATGCDPAYSIGRYRKLPEYEEKRGLQAAGLMKSRYTVHSCEASLNFLVHGDHGNAKKWAGTALECGETYFFGEWRELAPSGNGFDQPPSREFQDIHQLWVDYYDWTMCLCSAIGRWAEFERFAMYLRDDVSIAPDQTEAHRAWWLYFCGQIRKRPSKQLEAFRETVMTAKRAKTDQLLLSWVDALVSGSHDELRDAITKYFQHHRKVEVKKPGYGLAIRGSMLLHYGKYIGREVDRPANTDLYVVEFDGE